MRRVLNRTGLSRSSLPRHEADAVAWRLLLPRDAAATTPPLVDFFEALPRRRGRHRLPPIPGLRFDVSAAHFREASGGSVNARAWKRWQVRMEDVEAAAAAQANARGPTEPLLPVHLAATHRSMRTGDRAAHLQTACQWAALHETAAYK